MYSENYTPLAEQNNPEYIGYGNYQFEYEVTLFNTQILIKDDAPIRRPPTG